MATKTRKAEPDFLSYRTLAVRSDSIDEEERSIEILLSTENPVPTPDFERREMVPEVLLTEGVVLPGNRQVPLLDSHDRKSTGAQLGSIRKLAKASEGVTGRAMFSSVSDKEWTKVREGHVTDVSAGYQVLERTYVPKGKTQIVSGRNYSGPVSVVTKWKLREGSITPIGADEQAKMRGISDGFPDAPETKEQSMNAEFRALCVENGMPESTSDADSLVWAKTNLGKREAATDPPPNGDKGRQDPPAETREDKADEEARFLKLLNGALDAREQKRTQFRAEVDSLCELADVPDEKDRCYGLDNLTKVREHIVNAKKNRSAVIPGLPRVEGSARDATFSAYQTAFTLRTMSSCGARQETIDKIFPVAERSKAPEVDQMRYRTMMDIAQDCLRMDGIDIRGLSREQTAIAALGFLQQANVRASFDPAYHVTGSFPKLTQDAMNKSMMVGYTECPSTWQICFRTGDSVADFKTIHRMRLGAIPNLPDWPDNTSPESVSLADAEETYKVEPKSLKISFSYRLLVNDDTSMVSRIPSMFGAAAARTVNAAAWAQVTSNPTMTDGQALFLATATGNRKRSNLTTGSATPTIATRQTMANKMRQMRGENTPEGNEGPDILNLEPRFMVGPTALETAINQLVFGPYDPQSSQFMTYNPATNLTPIIEPLLDANSTTAFYLFAHYSQIDTVEVTFLQGHESPVVRNWADFDTLAQNAAVLQAFAAKVLNHRGLQRHDGA